MEKKWGIFIKLGLKAAENKGWRIREAIFIDTGGNVMGDNQNDRRSIWLILFDIIALITAAFGSVLSSYKILSLILGIITCIILVALLVKEYSYVGAIIGVLVSVFLMLLMIHQILKKPIDEFSDKISEDAILGNLEVNVEELIVGYNDESGNKKITSDIKKANR